MSQNEAADNYIFVYGILRKAFDLPLLKEIENDIQWMGNTEIKGKLYDIGEYPGAKPDKTNSFIEGDVFKIIRPRKVLKVLDEYEGYYPTRIAESEYLREKETIQLSDGQKVQAWVYWYNLPVEPKQRIRYKDYLKYLKNNKTA